MKGLILLGLMLIAVVAMLAQAQYLARTHEPTVAAFMPGNTAYRASPIEEEAGCS